MELIKTVGSYLLAVWFGAAMGFMVFALFAGRRNK